MSARRRSDSTSLVAGSDLAHLDGGPLGRGALGGEPQRLLARAAVEQEKAADELLRFRKGPIDHAVPSTANAETRRALTQRVARDQDATRLQRLGVVEHELIDAASLLHRTVAPLALRLDDQQHVCHQISPRAQ